MSLETPRNEWQLFGKLFIGHLVCYCVVKKSHSQNVNMLFTFLSHANYHIFCCYQQVSASGNYGCIHLAFPTSNKSNEMSCGGQWNLPYTYMGIPVQFLELEISSKNQSPTVTKSLKEVLKVAFSSDTQDTSTDG